LDAGKIAEFGSPQELLNDPNSMFASLAAHAGATPTTGKGKEKS